MYFPIYSILFIIIFVLVPISFRRFHGAFRSYLGNRNDDDAGDGDGGCSICS